MADITVELDSIIDTIDSRVLNIPVIKREVKKASKGYVTNNRKCVYQVTFLASCLFVVNEARAAISLLQVIDENTTINLPGRRSLDGSCAVARLLLAHIYRVTEQSRLSEEILSRDGLEASGSFEIDFPIQSEIQEAKVNLEYAEKDEESRHSDYVLCSYEGFIATVVIYERLPTLSYELNPYTEDVVVSSLAFFKEKLRYYLEVKPK